MRQSEYSMVLAFNRTFIRKLNWVLLSLHALLFLIFTVLHVYLMSVVNIFSVLTYAGAFLLIETNRIAYIRTVYLEILVHMTIATIALGWDYGFQLYCFGLIPIIFYAEYLLRKIDTYHYRPVGVSVGILGIFLALKLYTSFFLPLYQIPFLQIHILAYLLNTIMIGSFTICFMVVFAKMNQSSEELIRRDVLTDRLTGLGNRARMMEIQDKYVDMNFPAQSDVFIAVLDIDDFKHVNDSYGHQAGDFILRQVAIYLQMMETDSLHLCRWGGEEFIFFGIGKNLYEPTLQLLEDLKSRIAHTDFCYNDICIQITVTVGIARLEQESSLEMLIQRADEYLYWGKQHGKNQVVGSEMQPDYKKSV